MAEIVTWTERDVATLERIQERVLWLATYMVHHANHLRPNGDGLKVGGHQASSASLVTVMTALYGAFLRPGDRVAVKPHASPVFHAIQYLRGRLPEDALRRFRAYQGLQAYPSRTKDVDEVDYSTGSVGLGAVAAAFGGLTRQYLHDHFGLDGRLDFGVGRGYQPAEFAGFGVPMEESRARFDEALTIVRRAWTEDRVTFEGRFFTVRDVRVLPKPVQKPHPPIWAAAVSPESFPEMARQGLHILTAPSITPPALMKQSYDAYRRVWQESGHPPERIEVPALHFVYVGASESRARREPEPNLMWYFDTVRGLIAPDHPDEVAAGYGFYAKARRHLERVDYDHLYGDVVLFGDAERVTERIRVLRDDLGVTYLMCWMNFGGLASDLARDSIRRFAEHVMPKFR